MRVVAGNAWYRDRVIEAGCGPQRVQVIYTPLDSLFHQTPSNTGFRSEVSIPETARVITIAATALESPRKRIREALQVAESVMISEPDVFLVVVGANCPPIPGRIEDRTRTTGIVSTGQLARVLADTDIFLSTASEDGGPMMVAAALACGASVAATAIGYGADLLVGDSAGETFPLLGEVTSVLPSWPETVLRVLGRRSDDVPGAVAACKRLGRLFSADSSASSYLGVYSELLADVRT